jgi:hypothetical protein
LLERHPRAQDERVPGRARPVEADAGDRVPVAGAAAVPEPGQLPLLVLEHGRGVDLADLLADVGGLAAGHVGLVQATGHQRRRGPPGQGPVAAAGMAQPPASWQ